jgi:hypothetical protein
MSNGGQDKGRAQEIKKMEEVRQPGMELILQKPSWSSQIA